MDGGGGGFGGTAPNIDTIAAAAAGKNFLSTGGGGAAAASLTIGVVNSFQIHDISCCCCLTVRAWKTVTVCGYIYPWLKIKSLRKIRLLLGWFTATLEGEREGKPVLNTKLTDALWSTVVLSLIYSRAKVTT
jgi:hypothetical protein